MMEHRRSLSRLHQALTRGQISRREFLERATALGMSAAVATFVINAHDMKGAAAQDATPSSGASMVGPERPAVGMENAARGEGDELRLLVWQAPTHLSPHNATGTKDYLAASLVLESLMNYTPDSTLVATLAAEVPTVESGLLAEDLSSVTYRLLPDVVWSDGEPFTARDVEFTWKWLTNPANAATSANLYANVTNVEVIDDVTVTVSFAEPTLAWYVPFTGNNGGQIYPGHLWGFDPANTEVINSFRSNPTGTGPYRVESFAENDQVTYVVNELFREPNKPFFPTVNMKGGGDAASAARAVLQTADYDYAWNLQVEPQILADLVAAGNGVVNTRPGTGTESLYINFADPNMEVDGQRAEMNTPHPILSDPAVRQALASAIDRGTIALELYGEGEPAATNYLVGIPAYDSARAPFTYDAAAANQLLDEAGWVLDGETRKKDGMELSFVYQTSINSVRQKTQAVIKDNLADIGVNVDLKSIDSGIYFDSAEGNDQNFGHFYADLEMFSIGPTQPFPTDYMANFYAGPDGSNVSQRANAWAGSNLSRYRNPDYDAAFEEVLITTDPERAAELFITMNDILIDDAAVIPLVQRAAGKSAVSNRLNLDNIARGPWEGDVWNIMNWRTAQ
jgi:peptide/nickel transport system substrate-binding protein